MRKVTSANRLQTLTADYCLGFATADSQRSGSKGAQAKYSDEMGYEGERDAGDPGRTAMKYVDKDSVEARFLMRMRSRQEDVVFLQLEAGRKIAMLQSIGADMISELDEDGDFQPYSRKTLSDNPELERKLSEAQQLANERERERATAVRSRRETEDELQALKRQEAESRHKAEALEIENSRLKALAVGAKAE